jgi:predicted MFS family arabinose efflux permease
MLLANVHSTTLTYPRLAIIVASRLLLNAVFRVAYPLVPFVAVHYGVTLQAATWLVTTQVLAALLSPIGGWLADYQGYRRTMQAGLLIASMGAMAIALTSGFAALIAAATLIGIGTSIYQPSMLAYVSDHVPLARRGRALGVVELSWSLAGIVAVPILVRVVEWNGNLRLPFAMISALILTLLAVGMLLLPADYRQPSSDVHPRPALRDVLTRPSVVFLLLFMWLALCGEEVLFIAQVPWLVEHFAATPQAISNALFFFGIGELAGVSLVTAFADRIGKVRAPVLGFSAAVLVYVLLPLFGQTWTSYLIFFMLFAVAFEFGIVATFPLASSVEPAARGTVLAGITVASSTGRAAGSRIGVAIYGAGGIIANGLVAAILTLIGVAVAAKYVRPREIEHAPPLAGPVTDL